MAIQGIPTIQDERNSVPFLTAQALTPRLVGRGMVEKFAIRAIGTARNDIAAMVAGKQKGWSKKIP